MRYLLTVAATLLIAAPASAQLSPFNAAGITYGHVHLNVADIELAKLDFGAGLKHHLIPMTWVDHVQDDKLYLNMTKDAAKSSWREKH